MTNKELDDYMKTVNPDFDSHIEKGTIEMSNEYYTLLEEKMARIINQNQELNGAIQIYDILLKSNVEENKQLKDNWNKLKEFIAKEYYMYLPLEASTKSVTILIDKMQELEQGSDSNEI